MTDSEQSKNTIRVEFVDNSTQSPFAVSEVPVENLPDTFEIATNLEIAQQQWSVAQAIPARKEEFIKTVNLKVFLDKIQMMNPEELLYSIPTINYGIFEIEPTAGAELFAIHEDDWRQIEFVSKKYRSEIAEEIRSISEIYAAHKVGIGFDHIHIRKLIEQPLDDKNINLAELMQGLGVIKIYDGFGIGNNKAVNGFAFQSDDGTIFYGQSEYGEITALCVNGAASNSIERILKKYDLIFVNWCGAEVAE